MNICPENSNRYTRRVLQIILKKYLFDWIGQFPNLNTIKLSDVVYNFGEHKMNQIKFRVSALLSYNENIEYVYDKVDEFKDLKDLLIYLSPKDYYTPESVLLYYLNKIDYLNIEVCEDSCNYKFRTIEPYVLKDLDDKKLSELSIYFRSYAEILLDIKKITYSFDKLYNWLLDQEIDYDMPKNKEIFLHFYNKKEYSIKEILKLLSPNQFKAAKEIFIEQIKKDHNRFYKIIDNYYGLKDWNKNIEFNAYLKLFDMYYQQNQKEKYEQAGQKVLELLNIVDKSQNEKKRLEKIIKRILERG